MYIIYTILITTNHKILYIILPSKNEKILGYNSKNISINTLHLLDNLNSIIKILSDILIILYNINNFSKSNFE